MTQRIAVTRLDVMPDRLCFEVLETDAGGVVEATLDLNPGLAAQMRRKGHVLDLAQVVVLPEPSAATKTIEQVTLWN